MPERRYFIGEAVRYDSAGPILRLAIRLFGMKFPIDQGDSIVLLALYRGNLYFLDRVRLS